MRIVIDTHVIFSGAKESASYTSQILQAWLSLDIIDIAISPAIQEELARISHSAFVNNRFRWTDKQRLTFLELVYDASIFITPRTTPRVVPNDAHDDMWFACAKAANASYIVTKDKDMLDVGEHEGIKVVKPGYFVHHVLPTLTKAA